MEEDIKHYLGELYSRTLKEMREEAEGIRPFKCGWYKRKVEEQRAKAKGEKTE